MKRPYQSTYIYILKDHLRLCVANVSNNARTYVFAETR